MSYPNPNPIQGHNFIAPDFISYQNLYKILSVGVGGGRHFNVGHYYVLNSVYDVDYFFFYLNILIGNILKT